MDRSGFKWVVGSGSALPAAVAKWREVAPHLELKSLEINDDKNFTFDLSPLEKMVDRNNAESVSAFVALGPQFMNFRRFELFALLKERGMKLPPLIEPGAIVANDVQLSENVWIGAGAVIGSGCKIGYNCFIGAHATVCYGCNLGNSAWIESGVILGEHCLIGSNSIIRKGVILNDGVQIGKGCEIQALGHFVKNIPSNTYIRNDFDENIVIVGR
jgi:NDP-sugar pyrophosphorylase family protein